METDHKIALITGAGRGIGRAIAIRIALADYHLSLTARTREELEETRRVSGLAPESSEFLPLTRALARHERAGESASCVQN